MKTSNKENILNTVYTSKEAYEEAMEAEFRQKCWEVSAMYGHEERTTLDGEWTYEELKETMLDEIAKFIHGEKDKPGWLEKHKHRAVKSQDMLHEEKDKPGWLEKHKHRAVKSQDMLHEEFIANDICDRYDLIEVYNRAVDKHRNDKPRLFGIQYFDELVRAEAEKVLKENLLT